MIHEEVKTLFGNNDKTVSDSSMKTYVNRLKWLTREFGLTESDIDFLISDADKVISVIEHSDASDNTKKLTYIVLTMIAKKKNSPSKVKLNKMAKYYNDVVSKNRRNNLVADDRRNAWTSWIHVCAVFDLINCEMSLDDCQDKLIVGLYTRCEYTLRLDWAMVAYKTEKKPSRKYNHLVHDEDGYTFYLNKYKTVGTYGAKVIPLKDAKLVKLLDYWFSVYNTECKWLLISYKNKNKALSEAALSKDIVKIFMKYIGKPISNQVLREIKESDNVYGNKEKYDKLDLNEKYKLHSLLLHSYATAGEYAKNG